MNRRALRPAPATRIVIRRIRGDDDAAIGRFYAELSAESRRTRFLSISAGLSPAHAAWLCHPDHAHREGFVAETGGPDRRIVGHLCLEPDGRAAAEVAVAVADALQGRGIGRRLLEAGIAWARRAGFDRLTATMFADNAPIQRLLTGVGLPTTTRQQGCGVAEITIELTPLRVAA